MPPLLAERSLLAEPTTVSELVHERLTVRRRLAEPSPITFDTRRRVLKIDGAEVQLSRLAFYWAYTTAVFAPAPLPARLLYGSFTVDGTGRLEITTNGDEGTQVDSAIRRLRQIFVALNPDARDEFAFIIKRALGMPSPGLPSTIARINKELTKKLGAAGALYAITSRKHGAGYQFSAAIKLRV